MIVKGQSKRNMERAVGLIKAGELVAFPTETVYGLGADAFNPEAVEKIFKLKGRPFEDPLIVHIAGVGQLDLICERLPENVSVMAEALMSRFWPGPLTLIFKKKSSVSKKVTGGLDTVAVRVPQNLIALALIRNCATPIAAPSANKFQSVSPTSAQDVEKELGSDLLILDGGRCKVGVESTVVSFQDGEPVILRPGGTTQEKIEYVLGCKVAFKKNSKVEKMLSPGMLEFHYAPKKPLKLLSIFELENLAKKRKKEVAESALLCFSRAEQRKFLKVGFKTVFVLSPRGKLDEAASQLFKALRELDESSARQILALECPESELGVTLNDRLRKAAHK